MQNRKPAHTHEEMTFAQYRALGKAYNGMHQAEGILALKEMFEGRSIETMLSKMLVEQALEQLDEELEVHAPEMAEQNERIKADVAAKAKDVGVVIEAKNFTKEIFAAKQGMFSPVIVARRAEVEAMLDAAAERSASNSDTEEVSSLEVSPTLSPRM